MSKLWIFGDSFSERWSDDCSYSKWKGYTPKVFSEIMSERLGIECINHAHSGWSNYDIFESICENVDKIKENDIVIIGWSGLLRFRLVNNSKNRWLSFQPGNWDLIKRDGLGIRGLSENTINEIVFNRNYTTLYKREVLNWIHLLSHTFKNNPIINWTWSRMDWELEPVPYQTITEESNNEIIDWHWCESSHLEFSERLIGLLEDKKYIKTLVY